LTSVVAKKQKNTWPRPPVQRRSVIAFVRKAAGPRQRWRRRLRRW